MPSDVTGSSIWNQRDADFEFRPGPIFTNLLLADEINRAPPKTQAALLEAMQERQVTIEGVTHRLARPFLVLATQNLIEYEGTYPLPGGAARPLPPAGLVRLPGAGSDEWEVLAAGWSGGRTRSSWSRSSTGRRPSRSRRRSRRCTSARQSARTSLRSSARRGEHADLGRREPARQPGAVEARALQEGALRRDYVTPEDVKAVATPALAHRLMLKPELWVQQLAAEDIVRGIFEQVPTPAAEEPAAAAE